MSDSEALLKVFDQAMSDLIEHRDAVAVAYSGGLDSAVIARIACEHAEVACYAACVPESFDSKNVRRFAEEDGLDVRVIEISEADVTRLARLARSMIPEPNPVNVSYFIPSLKVIEEATEEALVVGNAADEILGGYAKYASSINLDGDMEIDLKRALSELQILSDFAIKRHKVLLAPYSEERVIRFAAALNVERKLGPKGNKLILRECAETLGIGAGSRPKRAAQYSSGVMKTMRRLSRGRGLTLGDWVSSI